MELHILPCSTSPLMASPVLLAKTGIQMVFTLLALASPLDQVAAGPCMDTERI